MPENLLESVKGLTRILDIRQVDILSSVEFSGWSEGSVFHNSGTDTNSYTENKNKIKSENEI